MMFTDPGAPTLCSDTGANASVYTDPTLFQKLRPPTTSLYACFGTDSKISLQGVGCAVFNFTDSGGAEHSVHVYNVLYVPTQPHNIICLRDILLNGGGINLDHPPHFAHCKVEHIDVYHDVVFSDDLPFAHITHLKKVNSVRKHVQTPDRTAHTHARFGHIGSAKLQQLQTLGLDKNDRLSTPTFACEVCTRASAHLELIPCKRRL
jgi:hypothetical protein